MFYSTQEAVEFGLFADRSDRKKLLGLMKVFHRQFSGAMEREQFDLASMFATQGQFYREALQADEIVLRHTDLF